MKNIVVFGSINQDLVVRSSRLPIAGETLMGDRFFTAAGGKGANQAVAAARLGGETQIVGRVGNDAFGRELLSALQAAGVGVDSVFVDPSEGSGVAMIAVDDAGENQIIIVPGANGRVNGEDVETLKGLLPEAAILLLQLEIPLAAVMAAAEAARRYGVRTILDPAPALPNLPSELFSAIDMITPNQVEAAQLVGFPVDGQEAAAKAAAILLERGVGTVAIKLGAKGVYCATPEEQFFVPAFSVRAVDTTAAGDAFNGALAVALAEGRSLQDAVVWGAAAGAISTMTAGAQPSMGDRQTLLAFLASQAQIKREES